MASPANSSLVISSAAARSNQCRVEMKLRDDARGLHAQGEAHELPHGKGPLGMRRLTPVGIPFLQAGPFLPYLVADRTDALAPAEGLHPTSRSSCTVFGFCYLFVWGYIADLSMVPRLRRGRLAGRALSHPFILRGQKTYLSLST